MNWMKRENNEKWRSIEIGQKDGILSIRIRMGICVGFLFSIDPLPVCYAGVQ